MKPIFIAGPCVIESQECLNEVAEELVRLKKKYDLDIIFKSSFDKANRTSIKSFRGLKVACLEGIAYRNGWVSEEKMRELAKPMLKNQYGQCLLKVIDEMKEEVNSNTLKHV